MTTATRGPALIRTIEFFSGIGGLRIALERARACVEDGWRSTGMAPGGSLGSAAGGAVPCRGTGEAHRVDVDVCAAFDINTVANQVYRFNFSADPRPPSVAQIHSLRHADVDGRAELWLLSPPCQPFTRGGLQKDDSDPRSRSLLRLINLLKEIEDPPPLLFLENVLGFEGSRCHALLLAALRHRGYAYEEYLLSPTQFGIPNCRVRYYCLAWRPCREEEEETKHREAAKGGDDGVTIDQPVTAAEGATQAAVVGRNGTPDEELVGDGGGHTSHAGLRIRPPPLPLGSSEGAPLAVYGDAKPSHPPTCCPSYLLACLPAFLLVHPPTPADPRLAGYPLLSSLLTHLLLIYYSFTNSLPGQ
eukprot:GHVU01026513.1.p1 GENE.GHVU01026513.1~~GHVU01026513.1.p1  ORF type:complete len:360 (-),score=36.22 GHVU01026513.1:2103-3182(-)